MAFKEIGIFRAVDSNEGWFEQDVSSVLQRVIDGAADVLGDAPGNRVYLVDNPQPGMRARRVGAVEIKRVLDDQEYQVQAPDAVLDATNEDQYDAHAADLVGKPDINRRPTTEPGNWTIQSLIFDKEKFTLDQARVWIANHDEYGDYGVDETTGSYRFRQYDTKWFDVFRIITITEGVSAVYAQVAEKELDAEEAEKIFKAAYKRHLAIKAMNKAIIDGGLSVLPQSCQVTKAEAGDDTDTEAEERFILGLVLEPTIGEDIPTKPDTQDDVYTAETIRAAAHGWMADYGLVDLMHNWEALSKRDVQVLESYIAPVDFTIGQGKDKYKVLKGTWLLALRVLNDALWAAIKEGDIGAFSIGGMANRQPLKPETTEA